MRFYTYNGPVLEFDKIVTENWLGFTYAATEDRARANLEYKFKTETGRTSNAKITLPGKLNIEGEDDNR